jgi:hypothetical protein
MERGKRRLWRQRQGRGIPRLRHRAGLAQGAGILGSTSEEPEGPDALVTGPGGADRGGAEHGPGKTAGSCAPFPAP